MGDLLRLCHEHPDVEIVGICHTDRDRMASATENFAIPEEQVFTDYRECLQKTQPDIAILCPSTASHAEWVLNVAPTACMCCSRSRSPLTLPPPTG